MFQGLIIYPPSSSIAFNFINISVKWYGIIMAFSILVALGVCYNIAKTTYSKKEAVTLLDFTPGLIFSAIIGARLFYIIGNLNFYTEYPKEIFLINHGGISIYGAIIFGIIYFLIYSKIKKLDFLMYADIICLTLPLAQAIGRLGNYFNQEAYGIPCNNSILKLYVSNTHRLEGFEDISFFHPTFLYESVFNILNFIILFCIFKNQKNPKKGMVFFLYLIFYSITRIIIETIRIDSVMSLFGIKIAQLISILILLIGISGLIYILKTKPRNNKQN